ncbi:unnamed protein product [Rotaria sp. Silwood1]|nr:unnamed protein product [Rotaria sp. Silwood1]
MNEKKIEIFPTVEELNNFAAKEFARLSAESIAKRGQFTVALSGGSTPKKLFQLLSSDPFCSQIDWTRIHFFFGDERSVPITSEESNYRMANENLFEQLNIPNENVHRFLTEESNIIIVAAQMETEIQDFFKLKESEFPRFDLIFLGMGPDGHTASLFPKTSALNENKRIVVENYVEKFDTFRLTFTYPTINNAQNIIFLIAGEDKAESLHEVLESEPNFEKFPSQGISPNNGNLLFLIDEKAAQKLTNKS